MSDKNLVQKSSDVVKDALDRIIDIQFWDDDTMHASVTICCNELAFGSAMWLLAEFVDRVCREYDNRTGVPYDYLQSKFSGHRSVTMREWKKEQAAIPPLEEIAGLPF